MKLSLFSILLVLLISCSQPKDQQTQASLTPEPETTSFSGKPLYAKAIDSLVRAKSDSTINAIRSKPELSEEDYVEIGRQLVITYQFKMAVQNFTDGFSRYPTSFKLFRYRGHRYINMRQLENAIADLTKAEELIRPQPEVFEVDAAGNKGATYQHQIWYHIGLYHFLKKNYGESASAFEKSVATAHLGRDLAGSSDWLYNAYQRSGQKEKAVNVLKPFTLDFDIDDKEYPYYRRLLLYNGLIKPEELVDINKPTDQMTLLEITKLYGLGNWYRYQGDMDTANIFYKKILDSKEWAGFAYAAAELDVQP